MLDKLWSVQEPDIVERKIEYKNLEEVYILLKELLKHGEVERSEEFWDITLHSINSILWIWANIPNPFSYENSYIEGCIIELENQLKIAREFEYNPTPILEKLVEKIKLLRLRSDSPLFDAEVEHLDKTRSICFVATSSSYNFLQEKTNKISRKWGVKTPTELRNDETYDEIVFFGQFSNLFYGKFSDPTLEFIFTSPRAKKIYWVHYEWISSSWSPKIYLIGSNDSTKPFNGNSNIFQSRGRNTIKDLDFVPKVDEKRYLNLIESSISQENDLDSEIQSLEEAYCFLLSEKRDGKALAVFVSSLGSKALAISDFDGDGVLDIWRFSPEELGKGMYILRRTQGADKDVIEIIADRHLGTEANLLRYSQKRWKTELSKKVNSIGIDQSVKELKKLGCTPANRSNLKRWMSKSSIRTSKQSHFYALMEFSGLKTESNKIWNEMRKINAAHSQAGFELDGLLKEKIQDIDATTLYGKTSYEFTLSGEQNLGTMTAFSIEERLESLVEVPSSWCYWGVREL